MVAGVNQTPTSKLNPPSVRASTSTKGYGLGLYLSRQLARQQHGDLVYEVAQRGGAAFCLTMVRDAA